MTYPFMRENQHYELLKKQEPFTNRVHLSDTVLDEVKEFKDLGLLTDNGFILELSY